MRLDTTPTPMSAYHVQATPSLEFLQLYARAAPWLRASFWQLNNVFTAQMLHIRQPRLQSAAAFAKLTTIGVQLQAAAYVTGP